MVVVSQQVDENFAHTKTCKPASNIFTEIPEVDLLDPDAKTLIVEACKEFGFFKVINHGVQMEFIARLEDEAMKFFNLPQQEKEKSGPPNPFGYGDKKIGPNGDVGWVEYLLFSTNSGKLILPGISESFWSFVNEYLSAMRNLACEVLEIIAEELKIGPRDILSRLLRDEKSDSCFRINHYPPCPELQHLSCRNLIGFGDHTDPQIISIIRSNNTSGLQIYLKDGTWVSVPPDHSSFFINVGDSLQVLTNGRFRSVRHRVLASSLNSRISMIFFGGPPLTEKVTPLFSIMEQGEESLYNEFTWFDYKKSAYKTKLSDNRLGLFEKSSTHDK
ncbi:gibberellin 2-beta-dioxygenase-like [Olea europaea subsp. europaea]|uniref:gibberellin 2beta-dioxygenase n=1 Tax=Olea europaea subsp. europaea TaxID=158383 RepID=A0A8S0VJF3_OLEEU|nr:gibberellin 2-beta-dioxygenase-like [Olea europaea subsp. europaea]